MSESVMKYFNSSLDSRIVGREISLFSQDMLKFEPELRDAILNSRILVIGGAGSIGSNTLKTILNFRPKEVQVIDSNENELAELVRTLRSSEQDLSRVEFQTLPFDYGALPFHLWMKARKNRFDYVLNFAALKHVRSEKTPYSTLSMLDTNVYKLIKLNKLLESLGGIGRQFCVSTDKAANPSSMMGATKRLMEHALFHPFTSLSASKVISARFANVAFSNGSLLQSWVLRMAQNQPLACPENCKRFFVSLPESGHLCTLATFLGSNKNILVPKLDASENLVYLQDVIIWFLEEKGYKARFLYDEAEAKRTLETHVKNGEWPVLLTPLDTAGEKPYEEFVSTRETSNSTQISSLDTVQYIAPEVAGSFENFVEWIASVLEQGFEGKLDNDILRNKIASVEGNFLNTHRSSNKTLDNRI